MGGETIDQQQFPLKKTPNRFRPKQRLQNFIKMYVKIYRKVSLSIVLVLLTNDNEADLWVFNSFFRFNYFGHDF